MRDRRTPTHDLIKFAKYGGTDGKTRGHPYFMKNGYVSEEHSQGLMLHLAERFADDLAQSR